MCSWFYSLSKEAPHVIPFSVPTKPGSALVRIPRVFSQGITISLWIGFGELQSGPPGDGVRGESETTPSGYSNIAVTSNKQTTCLCTHLCPYFWLFPRDGLPGELPGKRREMDLMVFNAHWQITFPDGQTISQTRVLSICVLASI